MEGYLLNLSYHRTEVMFSNGVGGLVDFIPFFIAVEDKNKCLSVAYNCLKKNGYLLVIEPARFVNELDKKFSNQSNRMIKSLEVLICSNKFKMVHFITNIGTISYLLSKN